MMAAFRAFHSQGVAAISAEVHIVGVFKLAVWAFHGSYSDIFGGICTPKTLPLKQGPGGREAWASERATPVDRKIPYLPKPPVVMTASHKERRGAEILSETPFVSLSEVPAGIGRDILKVLPRMPSIETTRIKKTTSSVGRVRLKAQGAGKTTRNPLPVWRIPGKMRTFAQNPFSIDF